jgi:hypothetical protein
MASKLVAIVPVDTFSCNSIHLFQTKLLIIAFTCAPAIVYLCETKNQLEIENIDTTIQDPVTCRNECISLTGLSELRRMISLSNTHHSQRAVAKRGFISETKHNHTLSERIDFAQNTSIRMWS